MSKKRFLLISLPLITILAIVCLLVAKTEYAKAYTVCENRLQSIDDSMPWVHERTKFNIAADLPILGPSLMKHTGLVFIFEGCGYASCLAYRNRSGWHAGDIWRAGSCLP